MAGVSLVPTKTSHPARAVRRAVSDTEKQGRRTDILAAAKKVFRTQGLSRHQRSPTSPKRRSSPTGRSTGTSTRRSTLPCARGGRGPERFVIMSPSAARHASTGSPEMPVPGRGQDDLRVLRIRPGSGQVVVPGLLCTGRPVRAAPVRDLRGLHRRHRSDPLRTPSGAASSSRHAAHGGVLGRRARRQIAHRRLVTDDGLSAEVTAISVVSLLLNGLLPR